MNSTSPQAGTNGPVVGIIIVIVVLLVGAFYFLGQFRSPMIEESQTQETASDAEAVESLEAELDAGSVDDLDAELNSY